MFDWNLLVQVVLALGGLGALGGFLKVSADKRKILADADKTSADATAVVVQTALGLLGPYTEQVAVVQQRLNEANTQIDQLSSRLAEARGRVYQLEQQVHDLTRELDQYRSERDGNT